VELGLADGNMAPGTKPAPRWCPAELTKMQHRRVYKLPARELEEKRREEERDRWFNQERPMVYTRKTSKQKRIEREEQSDESGSDAKCGKGQEAESADINMVFHLPMEFVLPEMEVAQLNLGAERVVFEKPEKLCQHMKPLYIKGHLDGRPVNRMLVEGGACVNIMPYVFENLGHSEADLMKTNMTLSGFSSEASNAEGIVATELTVGSKRMSTAFFIVDMKGKYNVLIGRDWIQANGCVPSTLHQFVIQWVRDEVEVIEADNLTCVAVAEAQEELPDREIECLTGLDLSKYDYVSVGKQGFVLVNVKPTLVTRLENMSLSNDE
jgi:hypothetical protein